VSVRHRIQTGRSATATQRGRLIGAAVLPAILVAGFALGARVGWSPASAPLPPRAKVIDVYGGAQLLMQIKVPTDRRPDRLALRLALTARLTRDTAVAHGRTRIRYVYDVEATARGVLGAAVDGESVQAVRRAASSRVVAPIIRPRLRRAQTSCCSATPVQL
jgi:hypothetical protein